MLFLYYTNTGVHFKKVAVCVCMCDVAGAHTHWVKRIVVIKMIHTHKNTAHLRRNVYFQKLSLSFPLALLQRSLPHPSWVSRRHATMESLKVKRRCLLFLKEYENTQTFPSTAVFLKCNLCLSFCRVLVYIGEYSNRMLTRFCVKYTSNVICCALILIALCKTPYLFQRGY